MPVVDDLSPVVLVELGAHGGLVAGRGLGQIGVREDPDQRRRTSGEAGLGVGAGNRPGIGDELGGLEQVLDLGRLDGVDAGGVDTAVGPGDADLHRKAEAGDDRIGVERWERRRPCQCGMVSRGLEFPLPVQQAETHDPARHQRHDYGKDEGGDFSRTFDLAKTETLGPTRVFAPVFDHFLGVEFSDTRPGCIDSVYRIVEPQFPIEVFAVLTPTWERERLYQRLRTLRPTGAGS